MTSATPSISIAITNGTGGAGATLGGTLTQAAVGGIATFDNITIDKAAAGYSITATATDHVSATSALFAVGPGEAAQVASNAGSTTGTAGAAVAVAPSVIVRDANNNVVGGVSVTFAVASGGGSITGATQTTSAGGIATVGSWTLGAAVGTNTLTATAAGLVGSPVTFGATGVAGAASQITVNAGNNQSATVGTPVAIAPSVSVRDANNNPVSGVSVTFAVASGGGSLTAGTPTTNASGLAGVGSWTLGVTKGVNTLTATSAGLTGSPVTFTATANITTPQLVWTTYVSPVSATRGFLDGLTVDDSDHVVGFGYESQNNLTGSFRALSVRLDSLGTKRWAFSAGVGTWGEGVLPGAGGLFLGYGYLESTYEPRLQTFDFNGNVVQQATCPGLNAPFIGGSRDDTRAYFAGARHPRIITADLSGNLDCVNTIDARVDGLSNPRIGSVVPVLNGLIIVGDQSMSNKCWSGLHAFVQRVSLTGQREWRLNLGTLLDSTQTFASLPRIASAVEGGETVIYATASITTPRGSSCASDPVNDGQRFMTVRMKADGSLDWTRTWNGLNVPSCEAYPVGIAANPGGGVVIAGYSTATGCDPYRCIAAGYSATGEMRWSLKPTFVGQQVLCTAAAIDKQGRFLYLTGGTYDIGGKFFVAKFVLP